MGRLQIESGFEARCNDRKTVIISGINSSHSEKVARAAEERGVEHVKDVAGHDFAFMAVVGGLVDKILDSERPQLFGRGIKSRKKEFVQTFARSRQLTVQSAGNVKIAVRKHFITLCWHTVHQKVGSPKLIVVMEMRIILHMDIVSTVAALIGTACRHAVTFRTARLAVAGLQRRLRYKVSKGMP